MRGRVKAYDADDGKLEWTFYTIPGPGELGHDTWPQDNEVWMHGGATVWQTPAVDPELGLIYFSTGNPGPRLQRRRARRRQPVLGVDRRARRAHRTIPLALPRGAPRPLGLRRAESRRAVRRARSAAAMRKGLAQVGKTGWAYILDRETGEPLIGIEERPVPQEPRQATAATQPYPHRRRDRAAAGRHRARGLQLVNGGRIFTPFWDRGMIVKPERYGRRELAAELVRSRDGILLFVCALGRSSAISAAAAVDFEMPPAGQRYAGGVVGFAPYAAHGHLRGGRRHDEHARVAISVGRAVLQRLARDGRRSRVRRPQRRPPDGARLGHGTCCGSSRPAPA